jgi:hypothetical protein
MIAAWQADAERFLVTPVYTTGERGPPICLEPAFQAYDTATNGSDDDGA